MGERKPTRSEDFISRELNTARDNTPATAPSEPQSAPQQDFETPPFMRKRLMNDGK